MGNHMALLNVQQYPVLTIVIDKDFIDPESVTTVAIPLQMSFESDFKVTHLNQKLIAHTV